MKRVPIPAMTMALALIVILVTALVWGFHQWPPPVRWWWRLSGVAMAFVVVFVGLQVGSGYGRRFVRFVDWRASADEPLTQNVDRLVGRLRATARGKMYSGAFRAWRDAPVLGIGPGMHRNLWPHYAAGADGDREHGVRPTHVADTFFSYLALLDSSIATRPSETTRGITSITPTPVPSSPF